MKDGKVFIEDFISRIGEKSVRGKILLIMRDGKMFIEDFTGRIGEKGEV